jgi:transaldolase
VTVEGLKATSALVKRGIKVNVTLIFSPLQAMAAAKCGATYLSPFVGRLDDIGHDGMNTVEQILRILRNYNYPAQVLAASLRNPLHVLKAAELGAHVATLPFNVLRQMIDHPLTDIGLEKFLADWQASKQKI